MENHPAGYEIIIMIMIVMHIYFRLLFSKWYQQNNLKIYALEKISNILPLVYQDKEIIVDYASCLSSLDFNVEALKCIEVALSLHRKDNFKKLKKAMYQQNNQNNYQKNYTYATKTKGNIYLKMRRYIDAISAYKESLDDYFDTTVMSSIGRCYCDVGDYNTSFFWFTKSLAHYPDGIHCKYYYALAIYRQTERNYYLQNNINNNQQNKNYNKALKYFEAAFGIKTTEYSQNFRPYFYASIIARKLKLYRKCKKYKTMYQQNTQYYQQNYNEDYEEEMIIMMNKHDEYYEDNVIMMNIINIKMLNKVNLKKLKDNHHHQNTKNKK